MQSTSKKKKSDKITILDENLILKTIATRKQRKLEKFTEIYVCDDMFDFLTSRAPSSF